MLEQNPSRRALQIMMPQHQDLPIDLTLPKMNESQVDPEKWVSRLSARDYEALGIHGYDLHNRKSNLEDLYKYMESDPSSMRGVKVRYIIDQIKKLRVKQKEMKHQRMSTDEEFERLSSMETGRSSRTQRRQEHERRTRNLEDRNQIGEIMKRFRKFENVTITINDQDDVIALEEAVRILHDRLIKTRGVHQMRYPTITARDMNGTSRRYALHQGHRMNDLMEVLRGSISEGNSYGSDERFNVADIFIPVEFEVSFINSNQLPVDNRRTEPTAPLDQEDDWNRFMAPPDGEFWRWRNKTDIDLSVLQIYSQISPDKYEDNCFVYACIQSKVFTDLEIDQLRRTIRTRKLPQRMIPKIAKQFQCNFTVHKYYENHDTLRIKIQTKLEATRRIDLLLYKDHYMLYIKLPITTFYLKNKQYIDEHYPTNPRKMLIRSINSIHYGDGMLTLKVLKLMFELGMFEPITSNDQDIIRTCEFNSKLDDYTDLSYDVRLCTREIKAKCFEEKWSQIYYADFESDVSVNPHRAYLCCLAYVADGKRYSHSIKGDHIADELLEFLQPDSLTYFHNLKYDACFFVNQADDYDVKVLQRNGTVIQLTLFHKTQNKKLTFHNSYSIIPAPLRAFPAMFKLNVQKEYMPYKVYTAENIERKIIPFTEFLEYYDAENGVNDHHKDIRKVAERIKALHDDEIDIMKYAEFYCQMDCVVLAQGMVTFHRDLRQIFEENESFMPSIHHFLSISAIGYQFTIAYGCLDGCYALSGKPQDFILRCVCGGRCMTANNQKIIAEGKIQDFDAVSLYPSAMYVMNGIPKGIPKILTEADKPNIMQYDAFFIEINIKSLRCKSAQEYDFGLVWKMNNKGSKIYCNEPIDNYYVDKRGLLDLMEYYDIEYEIIRGYYFNEGMNTKISEFIKKLFDLRSRYKKEGNALQNTIKLLLNSIYGKSILKCMPTDTKIVSSEDLDKFIVQHYNYVNQIDETDTKAFIKVVKTVDSHFNVPHFGATVLSWSKHLMNRVICLAEQIGIKIYYTDTDSIHIDEENIEPLAEAFHEKYDQQLIGSNLTQFHTDFAPFPGSKGNIHSIMLIALGKKSYLDLLEDEAGNNAYHIRMKGIPEQVLLNYCKNHGLSVEELYLKLYDGEMVMFDLTDGCNCFRKTKTFDQVTLNKFSRRVRF
jgi:hypothetical protein